MEVKQCSFCRVPFQSQSGKICRDCIIKLDKDFIKIRDYLYEHDNAGIEQVSEATGVSRKTILFLLKEERLTVGKDTGVVGGGVLSCESCKKPISTGRMCAACKKEVLSDIQESVGVISRPRRIVREETEDEDPTKGKAKLQLRGR